MSRSKKKYPYVKGGGNVTKGQSARMVRLHIKQAIRSDSDIMPDRKGVCNRYNVVDYRAYWPEGGRKATRK